MVRLLPVQIHPVLIAIYCLAVLNAKITQIVNLNHLRSVASRDLAPYVMNPVERAAILIDIVQAVIVLVIQTNIVPWFQVIILHAILSV